MEIRKQTQNLERYTKKESKWVVSALPLTPTQKQLSEIKPIEFKVGLPLDNLKGVLDVDGIVIKVDTDYLCSKKTLEIIKASNNPHYDVIQNGEVKVKTKMVKIGKTIPIISIDTTQFSAKGTQRDTANLNAGVKSVDYIYEGNKTEGIPNNLIKQINYTLNPDGARPGDSFEVWELKLADPQIYSIDALTITTTQQDGTFDTKKLTSFLTGLDSRMAALREDFNMIKRTFYNGTPPTNKGILTIKDSVASAENDITLEGNWTEKTSKTVGVQPTPNDKAALAQQKATEELATKAANALKVEADTLKTQQKSLQDRISDAGSVTDYVKQKGGWDKFVKEIRDEKQTK